MDLVIATGNVHKLRELKSLLRPYSQFDIYSLKDFPDYVPPEEGAPSFKENAILKASHAAKKLGKWVIADDSGLVVPALGGSPGVFSARYAGPKATDRDNRKKLLQEMENLEEFQRFAYFECALALAKSEENVKVVQGTCEGSILRKERGGNGFGYDPLFIKHDYNLTFAELEERVKISVSHRYKAFQRLSIYLI